MAAIIAHEKRRWDDVSVVIECASDAVEAATYMEWPEHRFHSNFL